MSDHQKVQDATTIINFLKDPVVKGAIDSLQKKYYNAFLTSKPTDADERAVLHAKSSALNDFLIELAAVTDAGRTAKANIERQERSAAQSQRNTRRN